MPKFTHLALALVLLTAPVLGATASFAKDRGPASATCDQFEKSAAAWRHCAENMPASAGPAAADAQHFYAGYWLAKNGRFQEALDHLQKTIVKNARVLTYLGFATRKLGNLDEAFAYYAEALRKDPDNLIARSYLGEAHLARDDLSAAERELEKIEAGCGRACDAYAELAEHIRDYRASSPERS